MNFSANDADSEIRINEISNYCTSKRTPLIKLDYPPQDSALQLRDLLKPDSFSQIFLPCYIDWHPEHRATNQILRKVIEELSISPNIIWYQVSLPLPELLVNSYMLLSRKRHNNKWREFNQYYKSQKFLPSKRFIAIEKITGNALGHHAAEVFIKMTSKQWLRQIEQIDKLNLDYTNPKYHLNDIEYTTKWVDSIKFQL